MRRRELSSSNELQERLLSDADNKKGNTRFLYEWQKKHSSTGESSSKYGDYSSIIDKIPFSAHGEHPGRPGDNTSPDSLDTLDYSTEISHQEMQKCIEQFKVAKKEILRNWVVILETQPLSKILEFTSGYMHIGIHPDVNFGKYKEGMGYSKKQVYDSLKGTKDLQESIKTALDDLYQKEENSSTSNLEEMITDKLKKHLHLNIECYCTI